MRTPPVFRKVDHGLEALDRWSLLNGLEEALLNGLEETLPKSNGRIKTKVKTCLTDGLF